jgi:hypothetical protein
MRPVEESYGSQSRIVPRPIEQAIGLVRMSPEGAAPGTHLIVGTRANSGVGADLRESITAQVYKPK